MLSGNLNNIFSVFNHFERSIGKKQLLNYFIPILGEREATSIIKLLEILKILIIEDEILNKVYFNISESRLKSIFINNL